MSEKKVDYEKIEKATKEVETEEQETEEKVPELEPIVDVKPTKYKKGLMERLVVAVIGPDGLPSISRRLGRDIVMPAIKNIIVDSITSGIHMAVFKDGDTGYRSTGGSVRGNSVRDNSYNSAPPTQYNTIYKGNTSRSTIVREPQSQPSDKYRRNGGYVDQYLITDRGVAQDILNALKDHVANYRQVSVAEYYRLQGIEAQWTDHDIGWTDLRGARISAVRGGYVLDLPIVEVL